MIKTLNLSGKYIEDLKSLARSSTWDEKIADSNFEQSIDDFAGGNIDDAYEGGQRAGEIYAARDLLMLLGVDWAV